MSILDSIFDGSYDEKFLWPICLQGGLYKVEKSNKAYKRNLYEGGRVSEAKDRWDPLESKSVQLLSKDFEFNAS